MSSQTFEVGNVNNGTWVLQSIGGAQLSKITLTNGSSSSVHTATFYDSPTSGSHEIFALSVPANSSLNYSFTIQLQRGLTVASDSTAASLGIVVTLSSEPDGPLAEDGWTR